MLAYKRIFLVMLCCAFARNANAVPVNYNESVNGDIVSSFFPPTVFAFDVGDNRIAGSVTATNAFADFDTFRFVVPAATQLSRITLAFGAFNFTGALTGFGSSFLIWQDFLGPNQQLVQSTEELHPPFYNVLTDVGPQNLFSVLPLAAGAYDWTHSLVRSGGAGVDFSTAGATWEYLLSFQVDSLAVPEPSTYLLLVLGLGIVLVSLRRSMAASSIAT